MKHKHKGHRHEWRHHDYYTMWCCDDFQVHRFIKCMRGVVGCEGPRFRYAADLPRTKLLFMYILLWVWSSICAMRCCNLSGGVALIVWFTTNGMCVKNNTILYVARASNSKRHCEHDLYCCLLPRCEALRTCRSGFPIATVVYGSKMRCSQGQDTGRKWFNVVT